jgi:hypothetical protein
MRWLPAYPRFRELAQVNFAASKVAMLHTVRTLLSFSLEHNTAPLSHFYDLTDSVVSKRKRTPVNLPPNRFLVRI